MNNAFLIQPDVLKEESKPETSPILINRAEQLVDIIESLQNIAGSNSWKNIQKYVFDVDLAKAKRSLAKEKDTTEMFRLQGDIRTGEKLNLESLIEKYRNELTAIKSKM